MLSIQARLFAASVAFLAFVSPIRTAQGQFTNELNVPPDFDQRGAPFARVVDGDSAGGARIDMGPFEFVPSTEPELPGDYNADDIVDAADYLIWRKNVGAPAGTLPNDIDGGTIGPAQYSTWRAHFGDSLPATGAGTDSAGSLASATSLEGHPTGRPFSTTAIDLAMADLATKRGASVRGGNYSIPRATELDGVARSRQLLLLDSVCERVTRATADKSAGDGNRVDAPTADGTSKSFADASEALFAELQSGPKLLD
jgi:hypothetical protein